MARRFVYGSYRTFDEADNVVEELLQQGIRDDSVAIVANDNSDVPAMTNKQVLTLNRSTPEEEESWWENLFGFLRADDYDTDAEENAEAYGIDYSQHQTALNNGEFLVVVDRSYESLLDSNRFDADSMGASSMDRTGAAQDYNRDSDPTIPPVMDPLMTNVPYSEGEVNASMENELRQDRPLDAGEGRDMDDMDRDSESIRLHEERLNVDTHREQVGEVRVTKEVIEDTEVVEVPIQREEVHITHVHPTDDGADPDAFVEETIEIPVSEDRVDISKETVVTDEVRIDRDVEETVEEVSERTRREVIDVEDSQRLTRDTDPDYNRSLDRDEHRSDLLDDDDFQDNLTN